MESDINVIIQIKNKKGWVTLNETIQDDRSYATFSVLANIRNTYRIYEPIKLPRGIPDDLDHEEFYISSVNSDKKYYLGQRNHSHFTLLELLETNVSFEDTYLDKWIEELLELKKKYKVALNSIRVVFGFDQ